MRRSEFQTIVYIQHTPMKLKHVIVKIITSIYNLCVELALNLVFARPLSCKIQRQ